MLPPFSTKKIAELYSQLSHELPAVGIAAGELRSVQIVTGGDINISLRLNTDSKQYFLKLNSHQLLPTFIAEAAGLETIAKTKTLRCPKPLLWGTWRDSSYLLLEFLPLQQQGDWCKSGQHLAQLHQCNAGPTYGFDTDTYCGPSLQHNQWSDNWANFFAQQRIRPQLITLARHTTSKIDSIYHTVAELLCQHQPKPALLHGDLWSGNISFCHNSPIVYDPAVYIGDRETDLAMTQLFGSFPEAFYTGYNQHYPIDENYTQRRPIYQLYHLLNHANLFGNGYYQQVEQCLTTIDRNT